MASNRCEFSYDRADIACLQIYDHTRCKLHQNLDPEKKNQKLTFDIRSIFLKSARNDIQFDEGQTEKFQSFWLSKQSDWFSHIWKFFKPCVEHLLKKENQID